MALSTSANEGSYVQAISNRWDNALPANFVRHTPAATDFDYPVTPYLTAAASLTFIPWEGVSAITVAFPAGTIFWQATGAGPTPPPPLVWNTAANNWEAETQTWD
jgi:hypothetical protein